MAGAFHSGSQQKHTIMMMMIMWDGGEDDDDDDKGRIRAKKTSKETLQQSRQLY